MNRLGRKPQGVGLVEPLSGSKRAKERMTWFLQTLSGESSVGEACAAMGIGESRFYEQRSAWLQDALSLLEPRSPGRPAKPEPEISPEEVQGLRQRVRELEARAAAAEVQAELAETLPHVVKHARLGKKTPAHRGRRPSPRTDRKRPSCRRCAVRPSCGRSSVARPKRRPVRAWPARAVRCNAAACRWRK